MAAYLTIAEFKLRTVMPEADVDGIEDDSPGWLDTLLADLTDDINGRLRKRYPVPFSNPPATVKRWLSRIATLQVYLRRGVNPGDAQFATIEADSNAAWAQITEAANSNVGLYDLPLSGSDTSSGVTTGGPLGYSEASPYAWMDRQREAVARG